MRLLLTLCLFAASALAADPTSNTAATPAPRDPKWLARHEGFVTEAKAGNIGVLFLGDSITDFWRYPEGQEVWNHYFRPLKAANFGIQSDRTEHVLWRVQNGELTGLTPKVVILLIGTNNLTYNTPPQIADGIKAIIAEVQRQTPAAKVLLLGVFPRGESPTDPYRPKIKDLNTRLAKFDDGGQHVRFLDLGDKFLAPDGTLPKKIMPDSTHPNKGGFKIWAKEMEPTLAEMVK